MAHQVKYRVEFDDNLLLDWKIDLSFDPWAGAITELTATGDPLHFFLDNDSDDVFSTMRPTFVNISVYAETDFILTDLCSADERQVLVQIYQDSDLYWTGFIEPGQYQESYDQTPYPVKLVAGDGLAALKEIPYDDDGTPYTGRKTEIEILRDIFGKIHSYFTSFYEYVNMYDDLMLSTTADSPLESAEPETDLFLNMSCYEVIEHILKKYNAIIRIYDKYRIFRPTELKDATVYGRYWTGDTSKASTNYTPLQQINRTTEISNRQQIPGGVLMFERPLSKVTIVQDYGYRDSIVKNWQFNGPGFTDTGGGTYNVDNWTETNSPLPVPINDAVPGESQGVLLKGAQVPATIPDFNAWLEQSIFVYLYQPDVTDVFEFSFEYCFYNTFAADTYNNTAIVVLHDENETFWLDEVTDSSCQWFGSFAYINTPLITVEANSFSGWMTYRRRFTAVPKKGNYIIKLYARRSSPLKAYIGFKNIKIIATADEISIKKVPKPNFWDWLLRGANWSERIEAQKNPYTSKVEDVIEVVSNEYEATNAINGIEKTYSYILGDVIETNIELILDQFRGALAVNWGNNFAAAAANFVVSWETTYLAAGVVVTSSGDDIIFTGTGTTSFSGSTSITNVSDDLDGSVVNTQSPSGPVAQVDEIEFSGGSGTANIMVTGITKLMTWDSDIATTVANFVSDWLSDFSTAGYTIAVGPDSTLRITADVAGTPFLVAVSNQSGDLDGIGSTITPNSAGSPQIDTVTLDTGKGTANITCDGVTKLCTLTDVYAPTSNWNTRGGSEDQPLLEIIGDEIAAQGTRNKDLIQMVIREKTKALQINPIGSFEDALRTVSGSPRTYIMNRGKFDVKNRVWDIDLIEII